jgi:hypothetical protein
VKGTHSDKKRKKRIHQAKMELNRLKKKALARIRPVADSGGYPDGVDNGYSAALHIRV